MKRFSSFLVKHQINAGHVFKRENTSPFFYLLTFSKYGSGRDPRHSETTLCSQFAALLMLGKKDVTDILQATSVISWRLDPRKINAFWEFHHPSLTLAFFFTYIYNFFGVFLFFMWKKSLQRKWKVNCWLIICIQAFPLLSRASPHTSSVSTCQPFFYISIQGSNLSL